MKNLIAFSTLLLCASHILADAPKPLLRDLPNPTAIAIGPDGKTYIAVQGEKIDDTSGAVWVIEEGKPKPVVTGLNRPTGLAHARGFWYVSQQNRLDRIAPDGKVKTVCTHETLKRPRADFSCVTSDEMGNAYVVDTFEFPTVYKVSPQGQPTKLAGLHEDWPALQPLEGLSHMREAVRKHAAGLKVRNDAKLVANSMVARSCSFSAIAWDHHGRMFYAFDGGIFGIPRVGTAPIELARMRADALCVSPDDQSLLVLDGRDGTVTAISSRIPGYEVDTTPLPLKTEVAFANLDWTGWKGVTDAGKSNPLRPIAMTSANDGTNRIFVVTQQGAIHVFDPAAKATRIFLDITDKVRYNDNANEEGLLGLAFHPDYKTNGEFFLFYTDKAAKLENIVARFRVSKDDPNKADPASQEELLRVSHRFWNHDGGTIAFGPDKMLYVALGDGGSGGDPDENGQNLSTLLGKILRIDPSRREGGKAYGIPADNPFVSTADARPEIWAFGLRNVWRMAFDKETGQLWAADVGQNLFEEINLIQKGGNYGWNRRESLHPHGPKASQVDAKFIDPIWEYDHVVGKSITGGFVYRGSAHPELRGYYLYADYVSGKIWALKYDAEKKRVVANRPIASPPIPIMSWGEDAAGEPYLLTYSANGSGIHRIVPAGK